MADEGGVLFTADLAERVLRAVRAVETMQGRRPPEEGIAPAGAPATVTLRVVGTTIAANIASGSHIVTPASMSGIFVGAVLTIDAGAALETVTVTAVTATTFTATFTNSHTGPGIAVAGAANANGYYPACVTLFTPLTSAWTDLGAVSALSPNGAALMPGPARYRATPAGTDPTDGATPAFLTVDAPASGGGGGTATFHGVRVRSATSQACANGATTVVSFASPAEFDTDGYWSISAPTLLTVPAGLGGYYQIGADMVWQQVFALVGGYRGISLIKNSAVLIAEQVVPAYVGSLNGTEVSAQTLIALADGDAVAVYGTQNSGVALDMQTSADNSVVLWMQKVG